MIDCNTFKNDIKNIKDCGYLPYLLKKVIPDVFQEMDFDKLSTNCDIPSYVKNLKLKFFEYLIKVLNKQTKKDSIKYYENPINKEVLDNFEEIFNKILNSNNQILSRKSLVKELNNTIKKITEELEDLNDFTNIFLTKDNLYSKYFEEFIKKISKTLAPYQMVSDTFHLQLV